MNKTIIKPYKKDYDTMLKLQLNRIQGKRLTKELKLYKEMFYGIEIEELDAIIKDNWETDEELGNRFFDHEKTCN